MDWRELLATVCGIDSRTEIAGAGATAVASLFDERLKQLGFESAFHEADAQEGPRGRHLMSRRCGSRGAPRLVLLGHTDTVLGPADVPFRIDEAGGRAYGAGVCDMKGGVVLMLAALTVALEDPAVQEAEIVVLLNATEEIPGPSFPRLARQAADSAAACLCFEPGRFGADNREQIIIARKAVVRGVLEIHGRSAHAGVLPKWGVSAVRELARKIEALEQLTDHDRDITVSVNYVQGGRVFTQIPHYAEALLDLRAFDPQLLDRLLQEVSSICRESTVVSAVDGATTRCQLALHAGFPAWPWSERCAALGQRYVETARRYGLDIHVAASGGGSDASHVADLAPTIDGLGILGGGLHQLDEWADLRSFAARVHTVADLMKELVRQPRGTAEPEAETVSAG